MRKARIYTLGVVVSAGLLVTAGVAWAITTPDLNSAVCTGSGGCFRLQSSNSTQALLDATPNGTTITATATGSSTAIKGFTNGSGTGATAIMAVSTGSAIGLRASSSSGNGVSATSVSGTALTASSTNGDGITAFTASVNGTALSGSITGTGTGTKGVFGTALNGIGVLGTTTGTGTTTIGVSGVSANGVGVQGSTSKLSGANGVVGLIPAGCGSTCAGVRGDAQGGVGRGVYGVSNTGWGVVGEAPNGAGIAGLSVTGIGAYAETLQDIQPAFYGQTGTSAGVSFYGSGGIHLDGSVAEKAGGGSWTALSDRRVKKDVKDLERGLPELMRVRPVTFKYNGLGGTEDNGKEFVGVIAQELETVMPSMVGSRMGKLHKGDAQDTKIETVDPSAFTYLLINAVKQQQRTIEKQEARIAELERRQSPVAASVVPSGFGAWAALALLPIGLLISRKRR